MDIYQACTALNGMYARENYYLTVFQGTYIYALDADGKQQHPECLRLEDAIKVLKGDKEL